MQQSAAFRNGKPICVYDTHDKVMRKPENEKMKLAISIMAISFGNIDFRQQALYVNLPNNQTNSSLPVRKIFA